MKVFYNGQDIYIEFRYAFEWQPMYMAQREVTHCLLRGAHRQGEEASVFATGSVVRHYRDQPNRKKAREAALRAALENFDDILGQMHSGGESKIRRRLFWEAYLKRKDPSFASPGWTGGHIACPCWATGVFIQVPCKWHDGHGHYPIGAWEAASKGAENS